MVKIEGEVDKMCTIATNSKGNKIEREREKDKRGVRGK